MRIRLGHPLASGLVAAYPFFETSGTILNDYVGTHPANLNNGPVWSGSPFGAALNFDGSNDYVDLPDNSALAFGTDPFSVSIWIQKTDTNTTFAVGKISDDLPSPNYTGWMIFGSTTMSLLVLSGAGTDKGANGTTTINDGKPHHIVGTRDASGNLAIYVDGVLEGTNTGATNNVNHSGVPFSIGGESIVLGDYGTTNWAGNLQNVLVYNRAISAEEVRQLYFNPYGIYESRNMSWLKATTDPGFNGWQFTWKYWQ